MREEGIVIEVSGGVAKVAIEPKPQCEHCKLCSRGDGGKRVVEAAGTGSVSAGDKVVLEVSAGRILGTSVIVYICPLAALVGGVVLGYFLSDALGVPEKKDAVGLGLGAVGLLTSILVLKAYDRYVGRIGGTRAAIIDT